MKIGILTFSRGTNYGAQLQALALMRAIRALGHTVVFLDRYDSLHFNHSGDKIKGESLWLLLKNSIVNSILRIIGVDVHACEGRRRSSIRFAEKMLPHTSFRFYRWEDVTSEAWGSNKLESVIVGSDQVWNCEWKGAGHDLGVYLMEGAPAVHAIAYAASFGMKTIPDSLRMRYAEGFKRFSAISTREQEGAGMVASVGSAATRVCDPTLLLKSEDWADLVGTEKKHGKRKVVMYFISDQWTNELGAMNDFAQLHDVEVLIFLGSARVKKIRPLKKLWAYVKEGFYVRRGKVRIMESSGPDEFVRQLAYADGVVTDSFHALMFSTVFHRNVRVIEPLDAGRLKMFSRLEEFASEYIVGEWRSNNIENALKSIIGRHKMVDFYDDKIDDFRHRSITWLKDALEDANKRRM